MNYKVRVIIDGRTYNLSTDVDDGYTQRVASYVDHEIAQVTEQLHASTVNAATITAMNIADRYFREHAAAESMRQELVTLRNHHQQSEDAQRELEQLRSQLAQAAGEKAALQQQLTEASGLRTQLKEALDECVRLRREIVRMGKS